jgi:hypothetical protein
MDDWYTGEVGDFLKVGLLRWLVAPSPFGRSYRLGVVRLRLLDEHHDDGTTRAACLDPVSARGEDFRDLDCDLYDRLHGTAAPHDAADAGRHSVSSLAAAGVLPHDTLHFDDVLSFADLAPSDRAARIVRRERVFHEAMVATERCSLVFVDPDEGLQRDDDSTDRDLADRQASLSEIGRLLDRGQSVVAHHHVDGSESVSSQAASWMTDIHEALGIEPLAAVRAQRDTTRMFVVVAHPRHRSDLEDRLGALQLSRWGDVIRLHRWHRESVLV